MKLLVYQQQVVCLLQSHDFFYFFFFSIFVNLTLSFASTNLCLALLVLLW